MGAFDLVTDKLISDITALVSKEKLRKSTLLEFEQLAKGEDRLSRRWTTKVPQTSIKISSGVEKILDRYTKALRYLLLGKAAGRGAKAEAEKLLGEKLTPGVIFGTYLQSADTQRDYYKLLFGEEAPPLPQSMLKDSFDLIQAKATRQVDWALNDYKTRILDAVDNVVAQQRQDSLLAVNERAHELKGETTKTEALEEALGRAKTVIDSGKMIAGVSEAADKAREGFERTVKTSLGSVSAIGAHQTMVELFGAHSPDMKAALINVRDGRCCDFCEKLARNDDGSFRIYDLSQFAPAGSNFYKPKRAWILCVPGLHLNCRCAMVYVPEGFRLDNTGRLLPPEEKKSAE